MGTFVSYMLQVSVVMTILYLAYKWLLSTSTFHRMNRAVLISIYAVSWLLPFCMGLIETMAADKPSVEVGIPIVSGLVTVSVSPESHFDWWRMVVWIYITGVCICTLFTLLAVFRMVWVIRSGRRYRLGGYIEVVADRAPGPFSWGRYVVVRDSDIDRSHRMVVEHEVTHLRLYHWVDLIPAQITAILQWFSPASWLLMRDLKDVHEFEVDRIVGGDDPADYQMMLLKKTASSSFPVFADSLNHSQTKKRLTMMMTKKSNPSRRIAALALPAAAALSVFVLSQPVVARVVDNVASASLSDVSDSKVNQSQESLQVRAADMQMPAVSEESVAEIRINPDSESLAQNESVSESVSITNGSDSPAGETKANDKENKPVYFLDGKIFTGNIADIPSDDIVSMALVKNDPAYPQGKILIVSRQAASKQNEGKVYLVPNSLAEFAGGQKALAQFIVENIKYPVGIEKPKKPVRVIVQFTITADGSVKDSKLVKRAGRDLPNESREAFDSEALRIVDMMSGKWTPAMNDGVPVASQYTIPIVFSDK